MMQRQQHEQQPLQEQERQPHVKEEQQQQPQQSAGLSTGFRPSDDDVICGWARQNYNHPGNKRFRELISSQVPRYIKAQTKSEKGMIITEIVEIMRSKSPTGVGMVRIDKSTGQWVALELNKAKDKVGHALRKATHEYTRKQGGQHHSSGAKDKMADRAATSKARSKIGRSFSVDSRSTTGAMSVSSAPPYHPSQLPPPPPPGPDGHPGYSKNVHYSGDYRPLHHPSMFAPIPHSYASAPLPPPPAHPSHQHPHSYSGPHTHHPSSPTSEMAKLVTPCASTDTASASHQQDGHPSKYPEGSTSHSAGHHPGENPPDSAAPGGWPWHHHPHHGPSYNYPMMPSHPPPSAMWNRHWYAPPPSPFRAPHTRADNERNY